MIPPVLVILLKYFPKPFFETKNLFIKYPGRVQHAALLEIFTDEGVGTLIRGGKAN